MGAFEGFDFVGHDLANASEFVDFIVQTLALVDVVCVEGLNEEAVFLLNGVQLGLVFGEFFGKVISAVALAKDNFGYVVLWQIHGHG